MSSLFEPALKSYLVEAEWSDGFSPVYQSIISMKEKNTKFIEGGSTLQNFGLTPPGSSKTHTSNFILTI